MSIFSQRKSFYFHDNFVLHYFQEIEYLSDSAVNLSNLS